MSKRWTPKEESILTQVFTKTDQTPQQQRHDVDFDTDKRKSLREKARKAALRLQHRSLAAIERKWRSMNPTTTGLGPQHKRPSSKPSGISGTLGTSGTSKTAILKTLMKLMKQKDYKGSDLTRLGHALQQVVKKGGLETIHQSPSLTPKAVPPVSGRPVNPFHASLMKQLTGVGKTPSMAPMAPTPKNPLFASLMKELAGKTKLHSVKQGDNKTKKPTKQLVGLKQKIQQMMVKRKEGTKTIDEMMEEKRRTEKAEKQSRLNPFTRELLKKRQQMRVKD
jgi:hypothetical protein